MRRATIKSRSQDSRARVSKILTRATNIDQLTKNPSQAARVKLSQRIVFVSDAIYPYNKGGKETRLYQITTRLAKRGVDVHVYTMHWWKGPKDRIEEGVHLHGISPLYPLYSGSRRSILQGVMFGLACFKLLRERFDVVDVDHMPFFPLYSMRIVCWLKGKQMRATWHEVWGQVYWSEYLSGFKGLIAWWIERISFSLPDTIISVSSMTTKRIQDMGFTKEVLTIPNGIDLETIESVRPSKLKSDIIFAGRLLEHKHVDVLLAAVALIKKDQPKISCLIIGDGPELQSLKRLVQTLNLQRNVVFLPFQNPIGKLYSLMKSSKVFVLPSTREGFGLVVLEANACGIPVITIDHPDNAARELLHANSGTAILLTPNSIANSIRDYISRAVVIDTSFHHSYAWERVLDLHRIKVTEGVNETVTI